MPRIATVTLPEASLPLRRRLGTVACRSEDALLVQCPLRLRGDRHRHAVDHIALSRRGHDDFLETVAVLSMDQRHRAEAHGSTQDDRHAAPN
jgi:hypothetical protein